MLVCMIAVLTPRNLLAAAVRDDDSTHKPMTCGVKDASHRVRKSGGSDGAARRQRAVDPGATFTRARTAMHAVPVPARPAPAPSTQRLRPPAAWHGAGAQLEQPGSVGDREKRRWEHMFSTRACASLPPTGCIHVHPHDGTATALHRMRLAPPSACMHARVHSCMPCERACRMHALAYSSNTPTSPRLPLDDNSIPSRCVCPPAPTCSTLTLALAFMCTRRAGCVVLGRARQRVPVDGLLPRRPDQAVPRHRPRHVMGQCRAPHRVARRGLFVRKLGQRRLPPRV